MNLAVFCVCIGVLGAAGSLAGCGERTPPPNARDVLNKNEKSISESLDKVQVEQDERDKPEAPSPSPSPSPTPTSPGEPKPPGVAPAGPGK